jgi:hypothetical protein
MRRARASIAVSACVAGLAVALAGCGGDGAGAAATEVPAVPTDCLQSWNAESASLSFGRHLYGTHRAKQAQVLIVKPEGHSINIKGDSTCAVIFAVEPTDYEYGQLGLVITSFGWASMSELARGDPGKLKELQAAANEAPNVNLFPDGSLQPL